MKTTVTLAGILTLAVGMVSAQAQIFVTSWNFNSPVPDANTGTGSLTPSVGSGTVNLMGGVSSTFVTGAGSSDPAGSDNSALNVASWASQGTESGMRGIEFRVPTVGYENIQVQWDQRFTATSSRFYEFQYSVDGSEFLHWHTFENTTGANTWINGHLVDLSSLAGVTNNEDFAFRILSIFDPNTGDSYSTVGDSNYGTSGTWRFDMVSVTGDVLTPVPEPEEYAMMAGGALVAFGLYRRHRKKQVE